MTLSVNNVYRRLRRIGSPLYHLPSDAKRRAEFRRAKRNLCSADLTAPEVRLLQQVSLKVNASDQMYGPDDSAVDYLTAGLSASHCIHAALEAAGSRGPIESILDFPCGFGRVLRFLRVMFPDSAIVAAEINTAALDFCKRVFSVETFVSKGDFDHLAFPRKFNLIWCGSLVTHLDEKSTAGLLGFFYRHLLDGGTCVFSTHGKHIAKLMRSKYGEKFNMTPEEQEEILRKFDQGGYGFANYRGGQPGYGNSLTSRSRIVEMARSIGTWEETLYLENGWHNYQDVYAFTKLSRNQE